MAKKLLYHVALRKRDGNIISVDVKAETIADAEKIGKVLAKKVAGGATYIGVSS